MNCADYQRLYGLHANYPVAREVCDSPEGKQWSEHGADCSACSDWSQGQEVEKRGKRVEDFPCVHMASYATFECDMHQELSDCSDAPILYSERFDEYLIGPQGGPGGFYAIKHCPWCGVVLPPSRRIEWYQALEAQGINPWNDDEISVAFQTDAWRKL